MSTTQQAVHSRQENRPDKGYVLSGERQAVSGEGEGPSGAELTARVAAKWRRRRVQYPTRPGCGNRGAADRAIAKSDSPDRAAKAEAVSQWINAVGEEAAYIELGLPEENGCRERLKARYTEKSWIGRNPTS